MNNSICEIKYQVYQWVHNIAHKSRNSYWWFHNTKDHVSTHIRRVMTRSARFRCSLTFSLWGAERSRTLRYQSTTSSATARGTMDGELMVKTCTMTSTFEICS